MIAFLDKAYHTSPFIPGSGTAHFQARRKAFIKSLCALHANFRKNTYAQGVTRKRPSDCAPVRQWGSRREKPLLLCSVLLPNMPQGGPPSRPF